MQADEAKVGRLFKLSACQDADKLKTYPTLTPLRGYSSSLISHGVAISRKSTLAIFASASGGWRDLKKELSPRRQDAKHYPW